MSENVWDGFKVEEFSFEDQMVYGNADVIAPYCENGKVLEDYYRAHNGTLKVIEKSMCGHHPHGLDDPTPIIEFVERFV